MADEVLVPRFGNLTGHAVQKTGNKRAQLRLLMRNNRG